MSYLLFINTSNLSSDQLDHLKSFKPLIREQILIFKNDEIIKYDNYFQLSLLNISFNQNCVFELNLKKFKSYKCSKIRDSLTG